MRDNDVDLVDVHSMSADKAVDQRPSIEAYAKCLYLSSLSSRLARNDINECFNHALSCDSGNTNSLCEIVLDQLDKYRQTDSRTIAATQAFVSLQWVNRCLQCSSVSTAVYNRMLNAQAKLLDTCCQRPVKAGLRKSASKGTMRTLRQITMPSEGPACSPQAILAVLTGPTSTAIHAHLIGQVFSLIADSPTYSSNLPQVNRQVADYYVAHFLSTKQNVTAATCQGLNQYFRIMELQDLSEVVFPAIAKSILRSPEQVVDPVLTNLIVAVRPDDRETAQYLVEYLTPPMLNVLKSSVNTTKEAGFLALTALAVRSEPFTDHLVKQILTAFGHERPSTETRALLARLFMAIPLDQTRASTCRLTLLAILSKESHEAVLLALIDAVLRTMEYLGPEDNDSMIEAELLRALGRGIKDKKASIRIRWCCGLATLMTRSPRAAIRLLPQVASEALSVWQTDVKSPALAVQNGWIASTCALTALFLQAASASTTIAEIAQTVDFRAQIYNQQSPFFLFTDRIALKVSSSGDLFWYTSAMKSVLEHGRTDWQLVSDVWSKTCLILPLQGVTRHGLCVTDSIDNQRFLTKSLAQETCAEIWRRTIIQEPGYRASPEADNKDFLVSGLFAALEGVKSRLNEEFIDQLLVDVIFAAHHPCLGDRMLWVELCQYIGRDPADIVVRNLEVILDHTFEKITFDRQSPVSLTTLSALSVVTTVAFVAPVAITDLVSQIRRDLSYDHLKVDPIAIGIWHSSSEETFVDVLGSQPTLKLLDQNVKEWDLRGWEVYVRDYLAQRRPKSTKPSKDEQDRSRLQAAFEIEERRALASDVSCIRRALGMVSSINKPYIETSNWFSLVTRDLLGDVLLESRPFIGSEVADTFLSCSARITSMEGEGRLLGLAIIETRLSCDQETKLELVNRVLYRLRYESEQQQTDFVSFSYAQILVNAVLRCTAPALSGLTGCRDNEQIDEQLFLALEYLNRNIAQFSDTRADRLGTVEGLVCVIENRPSQAADVRTSLQVIINAMSENIAKDELQAICKHFCSPDPNVRNAVLSASEALDLSRLDFILELWLVMHDADEQNSELAKALYVEHAFQVSTSLRLSTINSLKEGSEFVRSCAARALADTFSFEAQGMSDLLQTLFEHYREAASEPPKQFDRFGQVIETRSRSSETIQTRKAIGLGLVELVFVDSLKTEDAISIVKFLFESVENFASCPMADASHEVRSKMLDVGNAVIDRHGQHVVESLLPIFESALKHAGSTDEADWTREAAVILYGAAASYLDANDERVSQVIALLLETLATPSESVQHAIAKCLPPLVGKTEKSQDEYIHQLLCQLSDGKSYAERRGAAYGLSGVVKGCGLSVLRSMHVMESLEQAIYNKKNAKARQGALLAYECFASSLQTLWEPYLESVIPLLLITFADTDTDVRNATQDTARAIMSHVSGFGVQSILPSLLSGLHDHQWRSKKGSVELIGAMAYCAPNQLSLFLPTIVPKLNEVLTDSHAQVRAAGTDSLKRFGKVIKNPEIQQLVPSLLKALSDPDRHTDAALDKLLKTSFLHYIDSPSLSIVIPIVERGMQERIAGTKKKSAKIFGLLASLTSPNDLVPHLKSLLPCLRAVLVDTVPDVRATAAKALGSLAEKLGERNFPNLVDDLLETLNRDVASTDRQGAAQGLSEVLAGLGLDRLEDTLPRILKDSRSRFAYVREGFISLLIYLPATFGTRFAPYLAKSIAPILAGLADESEFVRDASLRAGKIMIANYATKSVDLMLPELERGMFNDSWRIRVSSLQLVGDLLFKVSGIASQSKNEDDDEDDAVATEAQRNALLEALGQSRRDRIFSSLYVARFDSFALVRSSAINVWKTLVANTPKTLKDILPSLIELVISNLSIRDAEKRAIYIDTLGDLMRKMGRDLLLHLLPAFESGLRSSNADRIGVCVAITEVLRSGSPDQIEDLRDRLVTAVKVVLVDPNPEVRSAANETFESLQAQFGTTVIDRVLPDLLALLQSGDHAEEALEALKGLMQSRAHTILPILLPGLLVRPMTGFNLQALSSLVRVAGQALTRRLPDLLRTILDAEIKGEASQDASSTFETILLSTTDHAESVAAIMNVMLELCKNDNYMKRSRSCEHLAVFFANSKLDYSRYVSDWLRVLISLLNEGSGEVVQSAWTALDALTKSLRKEEMAPLVIHLRRALQSACIAGTNLPGFSLPRGLAAILPILLQALLYGSSEQREEAAAGLGDVVQRTNADSLKVFITQITGPLIRIIGERSGLEVKSAILSTLRLLLQKVPQALKPFLPQLQRTFTKSLADPNDAVRTRAAAALGDLITLQTARIDPLIAELVTGSRNIETSTSDAMLAALFEVVAKAGSVMSETSKTNVISLVKDLSNEHGSTKAADLLGVLFKTLSIDTQARSLLSEVILVEPPTNFAISALNGLLSNSSQKLAEISAAKDVTSYLSTAILSTHTDIAERAILAAGKLLLSHDITSNYSEASKLIIAMTRCIEDCPSNSTESVRLSLIVIRAVARNTETITPHLREVGLAVFSCVRSMVLPVKLAAESAFVAAFQMTERQNELLEPFLESLEASRSRSIGEYAKRVATKVANAENERLAAGIVERDDDMDEIMGNSNETNG